MVTIRPKRSGFVSQICSCNGKRSDFSSGKAVANNVPRNESRQYSEVGDLIYFTLRTVPDGIGFDSLASRENSAMDGGNGDEVTPRSNMKRGGKRRKLSTSREHLSREGIMSSDDLHSSISSALAQLRPERQNQMSEKAERSFKLFTALKAAREFRQTFEGSPEAEEVADLEIKRLLKDLSSIGDEE
jgi:hypothetical protein